jgi:hypothetical protein
MVQARRKANGYRVDFYADACIIRTGLSSKSTFRATDMQ